MENLGVEFVWERFCPADLPGVLKFLEIKWVLRAVSGSCPQSLELVWGDACMKKRSIRDDKAAKRFVVLRSRG